MSGFGRVTDDSTQVSNSLNYVTMRVIGNDQCSAIYGSRVVSNNVLCGAGIGKKMNACLGGKFKCLLEIRSLIYSS